MTQDTHRAVERPVAAPVRRPRKRRQAVLARTPQRRRPVVAQLVLRPLILVALAASFMVLF
jgi:hypothetical protein